MVRCKGIDYHGALVVGNSTFRRVIERSIAYEVFGVVLPACAFSMPSMRASKWCFSPLAVLASFHTIPLLFRRLRGVAFYGIKCGGAPFATLM